MNKERYELPCNIAQTLNIIGDRWTLLIIHEVLVGRTTFNEIKKGLKGISSRILSDRLKYLEDANLLVSTLYTDHPPRYRYELTQSGRELETVFHSMVHWGSKHLVKCYKKLTHTTCGHEVEITYRCPHCNTDVKDLNIVAVTD